MIVLSPLVVQWALFIAASVSSFMIGKSYFQADQDKVIERTIMYLVENGLVRWERNEDGEIELLKLEE
jgi:hypothetical protein